MSSQATLRYIRNKHVSILKGLDTKDTCYRKNIWSHWSLCGNTQDFNLCYFESWMIKVGFQPVLPKLALKAYVWTFSHKCKTQSVSNLNNAQATCCGLKVMEVINWNLILLCSHKLICFLCAWVTLAAICMWHQVCIFSSETSLLEIKLSNFAVERKRRYSYITFRSHSCKDNSSVSWGQPGLFLSVRELVFWTTKTMTVVDHIVLVVWFLSSVETITGLPIIKRTGTQLYILF